ncbi:MAG: hypothetical protein ABSF08_03600 [Candidatus Cybelea sp.]
MSTLTYSGSKHSLSRSTTLRKMWWSLSIAKSLTMILGAQQRGATFSQLDGAIEMVTTLTSDYTRMITGRANLSMVPLDMTHALDLFKIPWIDKDKPFSIAPGDL